MYGISVRVRFSAGHRLLGYQGKCASPHGHSYIAEVELGDVSLDAIGMLADFGAVKSSVRSWIGVHWDHAFLLNDQDEELIDALRRVDKARLYLLTGGNPTAENLARTLAEAITPTTTAPVRKVTIWETEEQSATFIPAPPETG